MYQDSLQRFSRLISATNLEKIRLLLELKYSGIEKRVPNVQIAKLKYSYEEKLINFKHLHINKVFFKS